MASYEELVEISNDGALRRKILASMAIAADTIRTEDGGTTNHANRVIWAKQALDKPETKLNEMINLVLAANKDATKSAILGASDSTIQTNVNSVIDFLADGS